MNMIPVEKGTRAVYAPGEPDVQRVVFVPVLFWRQDEAGNVKAMCVAWESDRLEPANDAMENASHVGPFLGIAMPGDSDLEWQDFWEAKHEEDEREDRAHDHEVEDRQARDKVYDLTGQKLEDGEGLLVNRFFDGGVDGFSLDAVRACAAAVHAKRESFVSKRRGMPAEGRARVDSTPPKLSAETDVAALKTLIEEAAVFFVGSLTVMECDWRSRAAAWTKGVGYSQATSSVISPLPVIPPPDDEPLF